MSGPPWQQQAAQWSPVGGFVGTTEMIANVNTTAVGTISNTAETNLMTYNLPANTLNANNIGVRITAWGNTLAAANNQTIKVYFGSNTIVTYGPIAFGTGTWEFRSVVIRTSSNNQIAGSSTSGSVIGANTTQTTCTQTDTAAITIKVTGTNGVATVDGVKQLGMVVEVINLPGGGAVPNLFLPASLSASTATQALLPMGTSGSYAAAPGVANVNVTAVGTIANTNETDLMTYSLPANSLSANGKGVRITAWGTFIAGAANQTLKVYFGGTAIFTWNGAFGTGTWESQSHIVRTGSSTQSHGTICTTGANATNASSGTTAITDTAAITIKVTGQNGVATVNGVQQLGMIVEFIN